MVGVLVTACFLTADLQEAIRARPAGTEFTLTVERDGDESEVAVSSERLEGSEGAAAIGVYIETRDMSVDLPFEVSFVERDIGGPSAGLAYALAVYDLIGDEDLAAGRTSAATGQIDAAGNVATVGGVGEKAIAARDQGAEIFLVPAGEVDAARGEGITVRGVNSLLEAIRSLQA
jgi:Lon-like protease